MARYTTTPDLWDAATETALREGTLRLQSGQWVYCGSRTPSVFDAVNGAHIRCFHAETAAKARQRYNEYKTIRRSKLAQ